MALARWKEARLLGDFSVVERSFHIQPSIQISYWLATLERKERYFSWFRLKPSKGGKVSIHALYLFMAIWRFHLRRWAFLSLSQYLCGSPWRPITSLRLRQMLTWGLSQVFNFDTCSLFFSWILHYGRVGDPGLEPDFLHEVGID